MKFLSIASTASAVLVCSAACWAAAPMESAASAVAVMSAASIPAPSSANTVKAVQACEAAVSDDLRQVRGNRAQRAEFSSAQRTVLPSSGDSLSVKGEGRYTSTGGNTVAFTYRCGYSIQTGKTNGIVLSDKGDPSAAASTPAWQPDLTRLSPEACEAAVASSLKTKHPRVGRIAFGSDSRELKPGPNGHTILQGSGGVQRSTGMNAVPFSYQCEFESSGKLVGTRVQ
jgi:hypothetical protein